MPMITAEQAHTHRFAGNEWHAYLSPRRGSSELCAWRIEIPAGVTGTPHRVNREEILYVLSGTLTVRHDGEEYLARPGDAVLIPVDTPVNVDNPGEVTASAWVTTSVGFEGTFEDESTFVPEWVR